MDKEEKERESKKRKNTFSLCLRHLHTHLRIDFPVVKRLPLPCLEQFLALFTPLSSLNQLLVLMAPVPLENEDHRRDADFNRAMHGSTAGDRSPFLAMLKKDPAAQKAAVDEYFKHWDHKPAATETDKDREVSFKI